MFKIIVMKFMIKWLFLGLLTFSPKCLYKGLPNILHDCRGQMGPSFEIDGFFEKVLNPGDWVSVF